MCHSSLLCSHASHASPGSHMYISIMWVHIKYTHIDSLARAHSNIKDATQRLGFKQRGGTLLCYFKACHLFEAKLALRLPYPYFSPQLSFNQPMQMRSLPVYLSICPSIAHLRSLLSPLSASKLYCT